MQEGSVFNSPLTHSINYIFVFYNKKHNLISSIKERDKISTWPF